MECAIALCPPERSKLWKRHSERKWHACTKPLNETCSKKGVFNTATKHSIYSTELGIDLSSKREAEYFKWFLACLLFGKPIQQDVAKRTYFEFVNEGLTSPDAILKAGWDKLVEVLDRGHYVRYDFSTATKLLDVSKALKEKYGTITSLINQSKTPEELSSHLEEFKGVGPKTAEIFLRDIVPIAYGK